MRVIVMHFLIFAIFALINVAASDNIHDTAEETPSKGPRSLQKFFSKPSANVTGDRQPLLSPQTTLTTSAYSHALKKTESLDKGMNSPSSFVPSPHQVDSKTPSLLLLKHFRKQVPSPALRVPKPTVISSQETGAGADANTRLPVRFVGPSALITKSSTGNVHNDTNSSVHSLHDLLSRVTPADFGLLSLANGGSGALTQSMAETGYVPNAYSTFFNSGNGESPISSLGQSSPTPVDTMSALHHAAKDTMYPNSTYGVSFHTMHGTSTSSPLAMSFPHSATKPGLMTNRYGSPMHRGTESSILPPTGQDFSGPPRTVSTAPQSTTVASHARPNGFQNSFRRKQGESTVSNNLLINSPTTLGPLIKSKNKFSSVYSEVGINKQQTAHPVSNAHKVGVGTAGLTGVLVPGTQDKHLLKLLELISKANTGDKILNYTRNTAPTTVTQAPATGTSPFSYPLGKVSTNSGLKQDIGTFGFTTPSYPTRDSFRATVAPYKNLKHSQGPTVTPRTPAIHSLTSPSNFLLHQNSYNQRPTITPRTPVSHSQTSPSSILLSQSNPTQRPDINPRTPAMHTPTIPSGLIVPQNSLQWLSAMGHLQNQRIFNNLVPVDSSGSLLSLLPTRLSHHQQIVDVNRMGTVDSSDQGENFSVDTNKESYDMQSTAETIGLSGNQRNAANSSKSTASSDNGEDLGSLLHLVTAAPVEQSNVLIDMFEQVFSEDEVKNNPVVKQLHDKLEDKIQDLQLGATGDPAIGFLLYFLVPFAIIAVLTFTLMGVAPEYVGLTGLLIPLLILATLTNGSRKSRGRNARATADGSINNDNDESDSDILLNDAHISLLKSLESFEKSYMGT